MRTYYDMDSFKSSHRLQKISKTKTKTTKTNENLLFFWNLVNFFWNCVLAFFSQFPVRKKISEEKRRRSVEFISMSQSKWANVNYSGFLSLYKIAVPFRIEIYW